MQRTPEPELMDDREQAAAYAAADWTESHGKIPGYFRERFPDFAGGRVIDLVRRPDHQTAVQLVQEHARGAPPVLERDFMASLHAAYSVDEVREQLVLAGLPEFNVDQVDVLHWVAWGRAPI